MLNLLRESADVRTALLLAAVLALVLQTSVSHARASSPLQMPSQGSGFLGQWCVGGDPTKRASISGNGGFFNLTNESGSTSTGHLQGFQQNVLVADDWQFVQGTLSSDGNQINWSNGTSWSRCNNGGGGGGRRRPNFLYIGRSSGRLCWVLLIAISAYRRPQTPSG